MSPVKRFNFDIDKFVNILSIILITVDFTGLLQFLYTAFTRVGNIDDSFIGFYGTSGLIMHTLSLVNFIFFSYYFLSKKRNLTKSLIFLASGIFCFYGLGIIVFFTAFIFVLIKMKSINLTYVLLTPVILLVLSGFVSILNPTVFDYTAENIRMIKKGWQSFNYENEMKTANASGYTVFPRKLTMFLGVSHRIRENPEILVIGTGPGTYNSRASFLLNGDYSSLAIIKNNFQSRSKFATEDIYPLWNRKILRAYNDGTRNEPFSSLVSFPMEYGLPIAFLIFAALYKKWQFVHKNSANKEFLIFLSVFMSLNLFFENYLEYAEAMIIATIFFKLEETKIKKDESTSGS